MSEHYELRAWLGWRKSDSGGAPSDWQAFLDRLGNHFLPATWQVMSRFGLLSYLPTIFSDTDDAETIAWPDEIALLAYRSREEYAKHKDDDHGRKYGKSHREIFNFTAGVRQSKSEWVEPEAGTGPCRRPPKQDGPHFADADAQLSVLLIGAPVRMKSADLLAVSAEVSGEAVAWCMRGFGVLWLASARDLTKQSITDPLLQAWPDAKVQSWQVAKPVHQVAAEGLTVSDNTSWQFCAGLTAVQQ